MKLEVSRLINAPQQRVFDIFSDLGPLAERIDGIESVQVLTEGPMKVGTRWKETRIMMGKPRTEEMWITAMEAPNFYTAEAESCGSQYVSTLSFQAEGEGTRVSMTFVGKPVTLLAKLMSPLGVLFAGSIRKVMAKDLEELAKVCEAPEA